MEYRMINEYGNMVKTVESAAKRDALIEKGWHEELPEVQPEQKAEKKQNKTVRKKK